MGRRQVQQLGEKLVELSSVVSDADVLDTLICAINSKLENVTNGDQQKIVNSIRLHIEKHYSLPSGSLLNSFKIKDRSLTEPKLMWVIVCLRTFNNDRETVCRLISSGITRQKIYLCCKTFDGLNESIKHEKAIKDEYKKIIETL